MPVACCSPSKPIEHLVNTDGASLHTLYPDLANEHRVKEVTFALNPDALHRNASLSVGERADTSLPHYIMQKLDFFFVSSFYAVYAMFLTCPCSQKIWDFRIFRRTCVLFCS